MAGPEDNPLDDQPIDREEWEKAMADIQLTDEQVHELAEHLRGTCGSLANAVEWLADEKGIEGLREDNVALSSLQLLDQIVFCCEGCGWWYEASDMTENEEKDWNCRECAGDE